MGKDVKKGLIGQGRTNFVINTPRKSSIYSMLREIPIGINVQRKCFNLNFHFMFIGIIKYLEDRNFTFFPFYVDLFE